MLTLSNILSGLSEQQMDRVLVLDERAGGGVVDGIGGECNSRSRSSKSSTRRKSHSKRRKSSRKHKKCGG